MLPIRTILHPTDFSENSRHAFEFACALARDYGANLIVLYVYPTPVLPTMDGAVFPYPLDVPRDELLAMLNEIKADDPDVAVERLLVTGEPSYEIRRVADTYNADLIVMGTVGRSGLRRLVLGSVAEEVSRTAACPVLTVRSKAALAHVVHAETALEPAAVG